MQYRRRIVCAARRAVRRLGGQSTGEAGGLSCIRRVCRRLAIGQSVLRLCDGEVTGRLPIYLFIYLFIGVIVNTGPVFVLRSVTGTVMQ